ncbi:MAG TPA: hypothetical protein VFR00_06040 [Hyphomicrobiaceae bacterium]|nr:hypothetical protein [Hyphomicrobiaceae bacterium]HEU0158849.1 hypothetical protein [Hyphomicrobiaceae bacterium]
MKQSIHRMQRGVWRACQVELWQLSEPAVQAIDEIVRRVLSEQKQKAGA